MAKALPPSKFCFIPVVLTATATATMIRDLVQRRIKAKRIHYRFADVPVKEMTVVLRIDKYPSGRMTVFEVARFKTTVFPGQEKPTPWYCSSHTRRHKIEFTL